MAPPSFSDSPQVQNRRRYDNLTTDQKIDTLIEVVGTIEYAFPDGPTNHRQSHEAWMKAKEAEYEFWKELKLDVAKKGVWTLLCVIVGLLVVGISIKLGLGPK